MIMVLKKQIFWMLLLSLLGFASCGDDDGIGSMEKVSFVEFDFPQGDDPWDKEIEQIAKDWGVYIIYKNIDSTHLNRMWTTPFYYEPIYVGNPVSEEEILVYLDLVKNWLLGSLDKNKPEDVAQLPYYLYFINDMHDGNPRSRGYQKDTVQFKKDGFNYWSLSFKSRELAAGLPPVKIHSIACSFSYPGLKVRFESGEYQVAPGFADISNYEDRVGVGFPSFEEWLVDNSWVSEVFPGLEMMFYEDREADLKDPVNVYLRRGFVPQISETFRESFMGCPEWMPWIIIDSYPNWDGSIIQVSNNPSGLDGSESTVEGRVLQDFLNMIRFAMLYPEATVRRRFPVDADDPYVGSGNQKINQKYDLVVEYMKSTYGIDLQRYAAILTGEE